MMAVLVNHLVTHDEGSGEKRLVGYRHLCGCCLATQLQPNGEHQPMYLFDPHSRSCSQVHFV